MIVESKNYKGIEYVQLDELPEAQKNHLLQTINKELFIKIMIDGKIVSNCLQFKDYQFWFNSVFNVRPSTPAVVAKDVPAVGIEPKFALNN